MNDSDVRPTTHQGDLAKLPRALAPLIERPQWAVWRWTQSENGRWQKPPFMAMQPERHASTKDASTWSDYATALDVVRTGKAEGITYILTEEDPLAAIDLDHCRDFDTGSIDMWAQNFLDTGRNTYSEVTPSGAGCRIWGLADGDTVHKKFTLKIDGKDIAVELFRRTRKALTITGCKLDTISEFASIDRAIDWGIVGANVARRQRRTRPCRSTPTASTAAAPATASIRLSRSSGKELRSARTAATYST